MWSVRDGDAKQKQNNATKRYTIVLQPEIPVVYASLEQIIKGGHHPPNPDHTSSQTAAHSTTVTEVTMMTMTVRTDRQ